MLCFPKSQWPQYRVLMNHCQLLGDDFDKTSLSHLDYNKKSRVKVQTQWSQYKLIPLCLPMDVDFKCFCSPSSKFRTCRLNVLYSIQTLGHCFWPYVIWPRTHGLYVAELKFIHGYLLLEHDVFTLHYHKYSLLVGEAVPFPKTDLVTAFRISVSKMKSWRKVKNVRMF